MDKYERKELVKKKTPVPNIISTGITWCDGRIIFKEDAKWANAWYGICHYSERIFAVTPSDYQLPMMLTSIAVAPVDKYCERAYSCLYFDCKLNKFSKDLFLREFKDCGAFTLSLPADLGTKPLWFNAGKSGTVWSKFKLGVEGGFLKYDPEKDNRRIIRP